MNWLRKLYGAAWAVAVALLVLLAVYASLGRYYIDFLDDYQREVIARVESATGLRIQVQNLAGSWSGLSPTVHLTDLQIFDGDFRVLSLDRADVRLGVLSGLLNRRIELTELDVRRLALHFRERSPGRWAFAGIGLRQGNADLDMLLDSVMAVREARFDNTEVRLHYLEEAPATFWAEQVTYASDRHFRRLQATLGVGQSEPAQLIAESRGDPRERSFRADIFLRLDNSRFQSLAPLFGELSELADGRASGDLWLSVKSGYDVSLTGSLDIPQLAVGAFWDRPEQVLQNLSVQFGGAYHEGLWQFWTPRLAMDWKNRQLVFDGFHVAQVSREPGLLRVSLPELDAASAAGILLDSDLLSEKLADVLRRLSPAGALRSVLVDVPLEKGDSGSYRLQAELQQVSVQPWRGAPGIQGLNGYVDAGAAGGRAVIATDAASLRFENIYDRNLAIEDLRAEVGWEITDDRVRVHSGPIALRDGEANIGALFSLDLPLRAGTADPLMSLAVGLKNGDASMRDKYIPSIVSQGLRDWLDRSVVQAKVREAGFVYRGSLRKHDRLDRTVQLFLKVRDAELAYHEQWPAVRDVDALVVMDDGQVSAAAEQARLLADSSVRHAQVTVTPAEPGPRVRVAADLESTVHDALQVVRESPLRARVGSTFDDWEGKGAVKARLGIDLQLGGETITPKVSVDSGLAASELTMAKYGLAFSDISGRLSYSTQSGFASEKLKADWFERPLTVSVSGGADAPVRVAVDGTVAAAGLHRWLQQPALVFAEGASPFSVEIVAGGDNPRLTGRSSLDGMAIDLPAPLGKPADAPRALELRLPLGEETPVMTVHIEQLGRLDLRLGVRGGFGGAVAMVGDRQPLPMEPGTFRVSGELPGGDLAEWQQTLDRYLEAGRADAGGAEDTPTPVRIEEFRVGALSAFGQQLSEVVVNGDNGPLGRQRWRLGVSSDLLEGQLVLPRTPDEVLRVVLQRLSLPAGTVGGGGNALADIDPRELMDVDLDIDHLWIGDEEWGQLGFELRNSPQGASFNNLRGELRGVGIADGGRLSELVWSRSRSGDETAFKSHLSVADIGDVLERWEFARMLDSESGEMGVNLYWEGKPNAFSPLNVQGTIGLRLKNGRFLKASDTAGSTLRMVSIFNFANILRRLQLDFTDVFRKGIHYDEVYGVMAFRDGVMEFRHPLQVKGPSSRFRLGGSVNFHTNLTDMELVATLPIGSNLPWIAALVSGLPAAAGLFVASKLFEEQMNKYSSAVYSVTGPWQDPKLTFKRIFDDELSRRAAEPAAVPEKNEVSAEKSPAGPEQPQASAELPEKPTADSTVRQQRTVYNSREEAP